MWQFDSNGCLETPTNFEVSVFSFVVGPPRREQNRPFLEMPAGSCQQSDLSYFNAERDVIGFLKPAT